MNKILAFLEKYILPPISKLAEVKYLRAVRDGIVAILPLIIVGSFFLLLGQLPVDAFAEYYTHKGLDIAVANPGLANFIVWYKTKMGILLIPYRLTIKLMALYASFTIGYYLAKAYKLDAISTSVLSGICFIMTQKPEMATIADKKVWFIKMDYLGGTGLFAAILCAFFAVEVARLFNKDKFKIKMPEGVPPSVVTAFTALLPATVIMTITWFIANIINIENILRNIKPIILMLLFCKPCILLPITGGTDIVGLILKIFSPLIYLGDTLWAVIIINIVLALIWLGGIHGASVVNAVFITVWMGYFDENTAAQAAGQVIPHITTLPFYQWFVWIGGSGATLGLVFLMLFSRSKHVKRIGEISILPGICNINEPIIYGLPIVMNPILALPFIFVPVITGTISYFALKLNLLHRLCSMPPWTLPAPIGAFFATLFDWRSIVLVLINILIAMILYYPFLKEYEKTLLTKEENETTAD